MTRLFALVPSQWASGDVCEIFSFTIKDPPRSVQWLLPLKHMLTSRHREIFYEK